MNALPNEASELNEPVQFGPNAIEAEEAMLGMCLDDYQVFPLIAPIVAAPHFFLARHGYIFDAMRSLYDREEDVHMLAVIYELRRRGTFEEIGGVNYLTQLQNSPLNQQKELATVMGGLIFAAYLRRELIKACQDIAQHADKDNAVIGELVDYAEQRLFSVTRQLTGAGGEGEVSAGQVMNAVTDRLLTYAQDKQEIRGVRTGIPKLDRDLHGILPGDLVGVIGRSGAGKTTIMCQFAVAALEQGLHVVHFPTEQTVDQYMINLVSHLLKRPLDDFYAGRVPTKDILEAEQTIRAWPLTFYDRTSPSPQQVTAFVREKQRQHECDLVIVDGMSDMYSAARDTYQKTVECMTALHSLMRSGVPVLFSVQANRRPADRKEKRPLMADAQGGEIIGQKVTRFLSLYRPGYDVEIGELNADDLKERYDPNYVEIRILKDRFFNKQGATTKGIWIPGRGLQDASAQAPASYSGGNGYRRDDD